MKLKMYIVFLIICGCSFKVDVSNEKAFDESKETKLPNDIRWVTNSNEYQILCEQTYKNAWDNLSDVLKNATAQSAIIMDLDETVLDNSDYQVGLTEKNESYNPESWSVWVNLEKAKLVPGAKTFIDSVRTTQTRIIFLSNRMASNESPTIENMKELEIYEKEDIFLLRIDKPDKKHIRRAEVMQGTGRIKDIGPMNVLAYFGDARHDFPDPDDYYIFGQNMFMFPNPMYGKW
jgi:5'-nucleotidase (lipoprotein e(P4) family)|tara:strand:- start:17 stop:715 length:699 start_codon:yes stop_codon:yes gene_type:complete